MQPVKQRSFKINTPNRYNDNEEQALAKLNADLRACDHSHSAIVKIFGDHLHNFDKAGYSIRNVVKLALNNRYKQAFTDITHEQSTRHVVRLICKDVGKLRNKKSNPSIFFKFLGINNINNLDQDDIDNLISLALERLNIYISCDKNVLFVILKVLKSKMASLSQLAKRNIFNKILNSYFLYFSELQKEKLRKDFEIIKNFISHFKIMALLVPFKFFECLDLKKQEVIVHITLISFFIGSSFEERMFNSNREIAQFCKTVVVPVHNDFYFSEKQVNPHLHLAEEEISSFSDYNNCVPQSKLSDDILKNLYYFVCKLFNGLIDKLPQFFHSNAVWNKIIGENYYITSVLGFFKDVGFVNSRLPDERLDPSIEEHFFSKSTMEVYRNKISSKLNSSVDLSHRSS